MDDYVKPQFYSGTSNLMLPVKNKSHFPEAYRDKTRLTYYASLFRSIEINSSFYRMPLQRTVYKWANEVPADFRFTFKLTGEVTHGAKQMLNLQPIPEFLDRVSAAGNKRGCILVQLPPSFTLNLVQLRILLDALRQAVVEQQWSPVVEFRHVSWYTDKVLQLLETYNTPMVLHDMQKSTPPIELTSSNVVYVRFHGPQGGYRGSYSDDFLHEYASYIDEWLSEGRTVYAYFNNSLGSPVQNLETLNSLIKNN
jgi:uncharacterized protein YecE (DUF72 family)